MPEVDSTNRVLAEEARKGRVDDDVLIADFQTHGRGRLGRTWTSRRGTGLLMSISLPANTATAWPLGSVTAVSLAAVDACAEVAAVPVTLKWPNDLLVLSDEVDRKLGGVLAEAITVDGAITRVVAGIGLNVAWPDPPADVASTIASLETEASRPVRREDVAAALLRSLVGWLARVKADPEAVLAAYRERCCTLGREVSVELADRTITGVAVDVDSSGRILVEEHGETVALSAGDVVHLRRR